MIEPGTFKFLAPAWLLLLPLCWGMLWAFARRNRSQSMWRRVCDLHLLERMTAHASIPERRLWPIWTLAILLTLGITAAAGPSWRSQSHPLIQSSAARVVVLSLSRSMLVQDVKPTRFDKAVSAATEILAADYDGESGLVVFAGAAFVVSPLSRDSKTLLAFLESLNPEIMPVDGARVDLAIAAAQGLLEASVVGGGQILIITDGAGDIDAATRTALEAASRGYHVTVLTVGTAEGGPLRDPKGRLVRDTQGNYILSKTRFTDLERIAQVGNGSLIRIEQNTSITGHRFPDLDSDTRLMSGNAQDETDRLAANDGVWLVWLMLPFALLLFRKNVLWVLLLTFWLPTNSEIYAQDWGSFWSQAEWRAFEAYQQGNYEQSIQLSSDPLLIGVAYYRMSLYQQALEHFNQDDSATSFYNRGNTYAQQRKFPEAVIAYEKAMALNPQLQSAAYNKDLIQAYLQQQSQTESGQSEGGTDEEPSSDISELGSDQPRTDAAGQIPGNPGENQQSGAGLGASAQSGRPDLSEQFTPQEQPMEQLILNSALDPESLDPALIERWLKTLPESSSELFRRKFLRDYQRRIAPER